MLLPGESHRCRFPRQMKGWMDEWKVVVEIERGREKGRDGSGKWKLGQVGVTKHGICTLLSEKRGQPSACGVTCMFAFEEY